MTIDTASPIADQTCLKIIQAITSASDPPPDAIVPLESGGVQAEWDRETMLLEVSADKGEVTMFAMHFAQSEETPFEWFAFLDKLAVLKRAR